MDWQGRIVTTPDTLFGKPRIAGTRLGVDFLLDLLASGWSEAQILDNYPQLKPQDLQAVFAFVRDCMKDESFILELKAEIRPRRDARSARRELSAPRGRRAGNSRARSTGRFYPRTSGRRSKRSRAGPS